MEQNVRLNRKFLIMSVGVVVIFIALVLMIFIWLYQQSRQTLINLWLNINAQAKNDVEYYLVGPENSISLSASKLNEMLKNGTASEDVQKYLVGETEVYSSIVEGNYTGVYAYYKGEYLDASGWVPDEDYDPEDRPWYKAAKQAKGRTSVALPYMNFQTHTMMLSVSKLLDDKESVVAMDIFLVKLRDMLKSLVEEAGASEALIIDKSGVVVSHSDESQAGENYRESDNPFKRNLIEQISKTDKQIIRTSRDDTSYLVFINECKNGWYMILMINEKEEFTPLIRNYSIAGMAILLVLLGVLFVFGHMGVKQGKAWILEN